MVVQKQPQSQEMGFGTETSPEEHKDEKFCHRKNGMPKWDSFTDRDKIRSETAESQ